jgi:hypothetical protein
MLASHLASRPASRSLAPITRLCFQIPHVVRGVLGGVLELVIHSVERLRDHPGTLSQR